MNIEKHRAFLDSLEGEKGLPTYILLRAVHDEFIADDDWLELMYDNMTDRISEHWRPVPLQWIGKAVGKYTVGYDGHLTRSFCIARRRAESLQIPDLKERVKELVRDVMDAEKDSYETDGSVDFHEAGDRVAKFRALCATDKGGEVKP